MSALPVPVHQQVQLQVNPRKKLWKGSTELKVLVPPGQQTVGLHCFNLHIQQVTVNGTPAEYTLYQYSAESIPDSTVQQLSKGTGKDAHLSTLSEHAYDQYVRLMHKEQEPELLITIPQQQQQDAAGTQRDGTPPAAAGVTPLTSGTPTTTAAVTPKQEPCAVSAAVAATPAAAVARATTPRAASPVVVTPLSRQQQQQAPASPQQQQLTISITFNKPPESVSSTDTSLLLHQQCLVANPLLRRARGWFPCIDSPLHVYTPGAPHCLPYTFGIQLTVPPSFMAVCSGSLVQQTCTVLPKAHSNGSTAAAGAENHYSSNSGDSGTVVVARTFEYSVATAVVPSQVSIAVGPFVAVQFSDLLAAAGTAAAAAPVGGPVITVFGPVSVTAAAAAAAAVQLQQQQGAADGSSGSKNISSSSAAVKFLGSKQIRRLADTLKPLVVLLRAYDKVLSCMFPWSHLQVAVVPDGCLMTQWQAGLGSILLRESCCITDNLVLQPRLASASCLAAALAQQYFGLLLMPKGPEDVWLLRGLAGWFEGQGLRQIVGSNELLYRRWQERVWLSSIDDGEQLGPLSPQIKEGDKGFTAAWGRLHGTQDLEPCPAMAWKAAAVIHMLEHKIGEDELRKVLERYVNGAKHAAANTAVSSVTPADALTPPKPPPPAAPTTSGTTAGGSVVATATAAGHVAAGGAVAAAGAIGVAGGLAERFMTTAKFMRTMGKKQGFKKEASGFFNRWVHGTGVPHLSAGVSWDNKRSLLLLALKQSGGKAVLRGALKASEPVVLGGENTGGAAPGGRAVTLKILVRELDACEEHPLQVDASSPLSLHDIKITSKLGPQRRRMQAAAAAGGRRGGSSWVGAAAEDLDVSEAELRGVPVLWVQLDHGMEWLAAVRLRQPAHWWALQLEHSKDVVAQAQAVSGLAGQIGGANSNPLNDKYIISVLGAVMRNTGVFCRVRLDAAMALGAAAGKHQNNNAAVELYNFVRERLYDPYTGLMQPNDFTDRGEALINHGLPAALAQITALGGYTPEGILAQLLELLSCSDNSSNPVDDGHWLAALVAALGQLRLSNAADLAKVLKELDRMCSHEAVVGTHNAVLGCACLTAITQLATTMQHSASAVLLDQVRQLLLLYVNTAGAGSSSSSGGTNKLQNNDRWLRSTAYGCLLRVAAARSEADLRDMMAGLEAAAAAAAAVAAGNGMQVDQQQLYQQQIAYTAPYSLILQQLLQLTATTDLQPPLLLDGVISNMLQLFKSESDPVLRIDILKEALLMIGQLEQQGYYDLTPSAVLPGAVAAAAVANAAAVAAPVDAGQQVESVPRSDAAAAAGTGTAAADQTEQQAAAANGDPAAVLPVQETGTENEVSTPATTAAAAAAATGDGAAATTADRQQQQRQQQLAVVPVSVGSLLQLQQLLNHHGEPAVRQLAFMMLQKLAGQPPTLYREREEDEEDLTAAAAATTAVTAAGNTAAAPAGTAAAAAGGPAVSGGAAPSGSMRTGGRAKSSMPAVSAGGVSVQHTGTTAPTKIRLGKVAFKKSPAAAAAASGGAGIAGAAGGAAAISSLPAASPAAASPAAAATPVPGSSSGGVPPVALTPQQQQQQPVAVHASPRPPPPPAAATGQQAQPAAAAAAAAASPFAAADQQYGKAAALPPLHPPPTAAAAAAAAAAGSPAVQQQQIAPASVPSVAASVTPPQQAAAAAPITAPSTAGSAAAAAVSVPVRTKPLTKLKTLPGSSSNLVGSTSNIAGNTAAAAAASPSPAPATIPSQPPAPQQQQQLKQLAGTKRSASPAEPAPTAAAAAAAGSTASGAAPASKKMRLKKAGIPGQPASAAAQPPPSAAAPPRPSAAAPPAMAAPPAVAATPALAPVAPAPSAAPSVSGVTASGVMGGPKPKIKFKMPGFGKKKD